MSRSGNLVAQVAEAMADGEPVQWQELEARARPGAEQSIIAQLRHVAALRAPLGPPLAFRSSPSWLERVGAVPLLLAAIQIAVAYVTLAFIHEVSGTRLLRAQILISLAFTCSAGVLVMGAIADARARRLGHFYLLIAGSLARPLFKAASSQGDLAWLAPIWLGLYPEALLSLAIWRFARMFPFAHRFGAYDRIAAVMVQAAAVTGLILFTLNLLLAYIPELPAALTSLLPWRREDPAARFWQITYLFMFGALATIPLRARGAPPDERRRTVWFGLALGLGMLPLLAVGFLGVISPAFNAARRVPGSLQSTVDVIVMSALFTVPITTSYVVLVHRVLDVRVVLGRIAQYTLTRQMLIALAGLSLVVIGVQGYRQRTRPLGEVLGSPGIARAAALAAAATLVLATRQRMLSRLERMLTGRTSGQAERALAVAEAISRARTRKEIASRAGEEFARVLGVSHVAILEGGSGTLDVLHGKIGPLPVNSALLSVLASSREPVSVGSHARLFRLLPEADRQWLLRGGFELVAPIPSPESDLVGLVAISGRTNSVPFSTDDLSLLKAAATTLELALQSHRTDTTDRDGDGQPAKDDVTHECGRCGLIAERTGTCACGGAIGLSRLPATVAGKFSVLRRIGQGGMGVVYLARDDRLRRLVALKTLPDVSGAARQAMFAEATAMAATEHPNLALVLGLEVWRSTPILIVEYLSKGTLRDRLSDGPLPVSQALSIAAALADALATLHDEGLLHRDIKPSNIGFTRANVPKLLDFGLARLLAPNAAPDAEPSPRRDGAIDATAIAGTPLYLSPETLTGAAPDVRVDLWALSVVLFESIAGVHPFAAPSVEGVLRRIRSRDANLRRWRPNVGEALQVFIASALSRDVSRRPRTARALAAELRNLLSHVA